MSIIGMFYSEGTSRKNSIPEKYLTRNDIYEALGLDRHGPPNSMEALVAYGDDVRERLVSFEYNEEVDNITLNLYGGVIQPFVLISQPNKYPIMKSFMRWWGWGYRFQGVSDSVIITVKFRQKRL